MALAVDWEILLAEPLAARLSLWSYYRTEALVLLMMSNSSVLEPILTEEKKGFL